MNDLVDYIEFKNAIKIIFDVKEDMDETCDIIVSDISKSCILPNSFIRNGYDSLGAFQSNGLEMYNDTYREIAVRKHNAHLMLMGEKEEWEDETNQISYSLSEPSKEYCFHLINQIAILIQQRGESAIGGFRSNYPVKDGTRADFIKEEYKNNPIKLIESRFHFVSLKTKSTRILTLECLRNFASSYIFFYMYNGSIAIKEYYDSVDLFQVDKDSIFYKKQIRREIYSSKVINPALINYYTYAVEARNPFTAFISYYHIIEHFYEERDELESLKIVLQGYVEIAALKDLITEIDPEAIAYFKNNDVPFINAEQLKIPWSDTIGVKTVIAKRIYKTRNAVAHSKREQADKQYSPYTDTDALKKELPLIRAVAELVIIKSSEDIEI